MARYTTKRTTVAEVNKVPDAVNYEGAPAFKYTPELELALRTTSNFMENDFYASRNEIAQAIKDLAVKIGKKDPEYVMKLAAWLRNDMNMRSVSVYLLAIMAGHPDFREDKALVNEVRSCHHESCGRTCRSFGCIQGSVS